MMLVTSRSGVQNLNRLTSLFVADILIHFFLPNLNDSRITGASPLEPTSSTDDNSPARFVQSILKVAPVVSPSLPVGRKRTSPHNVSSPSGERPCHRNS